MKFLSFGYLGWFFIENSFNLGPKIFDNEAKLDLENVKT